MFRNSTQVVPKYYEIRARRVVGRLCAKMGKRAGSFTRLADSRPLTRCGDATATPNDGVLNVGRFDGSGVGIAPKGPAASVYRRAPKRHTVRQGKLSSRAQVFLKVAD